MIRALVVALALAATLAGQPLGISAGDLARADSAVRDAFAFLYDLPSDNAAEKMGTWVVDSSATTPNGASTGHWRLLIAKMSDTGDGLKIAEMLGSGGTSPAQLAASMAAMQKLEGKISQSEAEAAIDINITLNAQDMVLGGLSDEAQRSSPAIAGANLVVRVKGEWMRVDDRELEVDYERWSPAALMVGFGVFAPVKTERVRPKESLSTFSAVVRAPQSGNGIRTIAVTAQGNEQMLDRVVKETNWARLAALLN